MTPEEEEKIQQRDSGFRLGCPICCNPPRHFDTEFLLKEHLQTHCNHKKDGMSHCRICDPEDEWSSHPSADLSDSDFKDGGSVFN